jgi:type I restriction enzyme S subunit
MSGLPEGWASTKIGEICNLINGKAFKPEDWGDEGLPIVRIQNLNRPKSTFNFYAGPVQEKFLIDNQDLLFAWSGTPGTSFGAHIWSGGRAVLNQHIFKVEFDEDLLDRVFLKHAINQTLDEQIAKAHGGVGLRHVTKGKFEDTTLSLPPLPEQKRIVAKVGGLTARSARARADLDRIPTLITRYKQRLLALAFSGGLIGKMPVEGKLPEAGCWNIPQDWKWVRFDAVAEIASNLVPPESIPDLPHIAPDNIQSGTAKLLPYRTVSEDGLISAKNRFYPGQVLYSKIRPYLRKAVMVDFDGACSADMYPINARPMLEPKYLLYWLISDGFARFSALHEGRTVLPKINQKALNGTPFPLPPMGEQKETVRRIESALNWMDRMAADHAAAAKLVPKLDAAILAKAFRGELVPQDPNDEPARALLARIKAKRLEEPKKVRVRGPDILPEPPPIRVVGSTLPRPAKENAMTKSRQDDDVMGKPYLANLLKAGHGASAQDLFKAADLPVADFYKQLAWEIAQKHIRDDDEKLEAL